MKRTLSILILAIFSISLLAQNQSIYRQLDWGFLTKNGGVSMRTFRPFGENNNDNAIKLGFTVNMMLLNIDQTGDVAFIIQAAPGLGLQASLTKNIYTGIDFGIGTGFNWVKEVATTLQFSNTTLYTWNSHLNYGYFSSLYLGYNTGGERKRFTIRAGINPFAALSNSSNAVGKSSYYGYTFSISLGIAINKSTE